MMPSKKNVSWTTETLSPSVWKKVAVKNPNRAGFHVFMTETGAPFGVRLSLDPSGANSINFALGGAFSAWPIENTAISIPVGCEEVYMASVTALAGKVVVCEETYDEE